LDWTDHPIVASSEWLSNMSPSAAVYALRSCVAVNHVIHDTESSGLASSAEIPVVNPPVSRGTKLSPD
jgi:hypothetical protein